MVGALTVVVAYAGATATAVIDLDRDAVMGNTTIHLINVVVIATNAYHVDDSTAANRVAHTRQEQHYRGKQERHSYTSNVGSDMFHELSSWLGLSISALRFMED
jgi:hypothetical protein